MAFFWGLVRSSSAQNTLKMHKICTTSAQHLHNICSKSAQNLHTISSKSAQNLLKICSNHAQNLLKSCTKSTQTAPNLHNTCSKSAQKLHKICTDCKSLLGTSLLFNVEAFKTLSQVVLSPISRNSKTALYRIFFDVGLNLSASDKRDPTTCEYQITGLIGNIATWDRHMAEYGDMMRY